MTADWATSKDKARCNLCEKWCYRVSVDCVDPDRAPHHLTTQMFYCASCDKRWHAMPGDYEPGKLRSVGHGSISNDRLKTFKAVAAIRSPQTKKETRR